MIRRILSGAGCALLVAAALPAAADETPAADTVFHDKVLPILNAHCSECHDETNRKSGLVVLSRDDLLVGGATRGPAVTPGHPDESVIVRVLRGRLTPRMPLERPPLSPSEIDVIAQWIKGMQPVAGADAKKWWAVQKLSRPPLPAVKDTSWVRNGADHFILHELEAKGLEPSSEASRTTLLRRVFFDLVGMPPTPEEAQTFLDDDSPDAYEKLVNRLLDDPRYGERWGRHWLDLARYADTGGSEYDSEYSHMWRYRDYVIRAFNDDKPYDRFVIEQLAGDEVATPTIQSRVALGFLRLTPEHGSPNRAINRQLLLNEVTSTLGSVFLGVTLGCAQCHDHKYDPVTQKDFYRLQAFFVGTRLEEQDVAFEPGESERMKARHGEAQQQFESAQRQLAEREAALLARLKQILETEGLSPEEAAKQATKEELTKRLEQAGPAAAASPPPEGPPRFTAEEKLELERLGNDVAEAALDGVFEKGVHRRRVDRYVPRAHIVRDLKQDYFAREPHLPSAFVRIRGEYDQLGEMVLPGFPSAVIGSHDPAPPRIDKFGNIDKFRIGLAEWIGSSDNPLTPRVMVNRIWQHHFGSGLVRTPSNVGRNGAPPTHPQLLDWLAVEFVERGWSVKAMHRIVLCSAAYRQVSNRESPEAQRVDPQNRLLWRQNRRRLEGELIRDSILATSGRLNREMGGPGVYPALPEGMEDRVYYKRSKFWEPTDGPESRRRSVYIFKRRQMDFPFLAVLDAPVFNLSQDVRLVSTTPLQALILMNDRLVNDEAAHFALRVVDEAGPDPAAQVRRAYQTALAREPSPDEFEHAMTFITSEPDSGLIGLCRVLYNVNEFVYVD